MQTRTQRPNRLGVEEMNVYSFLCLRSHRLCLRSHRLSILGSFASSMALVLRKVALRRGRGTPVNGR